MRIKGIVVEDVRPGRYYLLRREPLHGSPSYHLSETPGRTNQSHKERDSGWLGTTNDVCWTACEGIEVQAPVEPGGRWRYRLIPAAEVRADEEAEQVDGGEA